MFQSIPTLQLFNSLDIDIIRLNQMPVLAARWQHRLPGMFLNLYLAKNHQIAKNSTSSEARGKISADLKSFEFQKKLMYV